MNKTLELNKIAQEIKRCKVCKIGTTGLPVPGEGNPDTRVMFIGEAPGVTESKTGRPFVGRSGKFLRQQIRALGLREDQVFIASPVKYLPVHGTPTPKQIAHGREHLLEQIEVINPKVIVLLGSVATQGALGEKISVTENHGRVVSSDSRKYFMTYHPAAALRFPKLRVEFVKDFKKLKRLI